MNKIFFWKAALLALVMAAAQPTPSTVAMSKWLNPFDSVEQVHIELKYNFDRGTRLFDFEEEERFFAKIREELTRLLDTAGIGVSDDSDDFVSVVIWGHQERIGEGSQVSVFMIRFWVMDSDHSHEALCEEDRDVDYRKTVVGLAEEGELESTLRRMILQHFDGRLPTARE